MVNMASITKYGKCAYESVVNKLGTKHAGVKKASRLFSVSRDPRIGTQITNNMTGTRYFQRGGLNSRGAAIEPITTVHYADGRYSSIPNTQFNKLLKELKQNPNNWNPIIKSDASIGKELLVNNPAIAGRYFRPNTPANDLVTNNFITRITPEHHTSMTFKEFDNMILNLLG